MSRPDGPPRWGILGGTFDPPHAGHLAAARAARDALGLDRVVFMVAGEPWQKAERKGLAPARVRFEMVEALVRGEESFVAGDDEIRRSGPTYTVETLEALAAANPGVDLFLILGADAAANLHTWRDPARVVALSTLVVVTRPGAPRTVPVAGARVVHVDMEPVAVSSSGIRAAVAAGHPAVPATTEAVAHVIESRGLYRSPDVPGGAHR